MENKTIYQIDAFTDQAFKGNPAGVMILDKLPSTEWMQQMAMEMNLSETAFVAPNGDGFDIRYYTPSVEIPLCGHATLASAHIMYQIGLKESTESIHFNSKGGDLNISKDDDGLVMIFPKYSLTPIDTPDNFKEYLGFEPVEFYLTDYNWVLAVANSQNEIAQFKPNFESLKANGLGRLIITAKGDEADFVCRCFVPAMGVNEDPVTGSAHCALTPLWTDRLGKNEMTSHQISKRKGELKVSMLGNNVKIKGQAVTVFEAQLKIRNTSSI
ncbi:PhzF family phenazine biosynthesis protein [Algibacter mikhailovii]|uniref:Isomerase n=1 Tax=Algibacter mikhailovii TaxID=425498 RepID=A0A918V7N3_9FLAO|nr:PhzF family phenazine biosynthesis protein [Algibacter mikhailovii]GGZ73195.1 isomerase [Algibacter mikhailovii]